MSHQRKSSTSGFKSRFSLLSLLPARHPPLVISHPAPAVPTQHVHRARPTYRSHDRVESSYGLTDDPFDYRVKPDRKGRKEVFAPPSPDSPVKPKHRPPPLDLTKTRAVFPTVKGVSLVRDDPDDYSPSFSPPPPMEKEAVESLPKRNESLPVVRGTADLKKAASKAGRMFKTSEKSKEDKAKPVRPRAPAHDSYDFVTLEAEHRYPSWKGGKVDIRPGEHIPPDLVPSNRSQRGGKSKVSSHYRPGASRGKGEISTPSPEAEQYESVLHNVLLTPTYLAPSTASKSTTDLMGGKTRSKRETLLGRASRWGKDVLAAVPAVGGSLAQYGGRSLRADKGDEQELRDVKPAQSHQRLDDSSATPQTRRERAISSASSLSTPSPAIRGVVGTPYRRSPAWTSMREREESIGFGREHKGKEDTSSSGGGKRPLVGFNVSWQAGDGKRSVSVSEAWRQKKEKEQAMKRKRLMWRCGLALVFIILAAVAIGVVVSQLTGRRTAEPAETSPTDDQSSASSDVPSSTTPTLPAPTASDAPANLKSCIEQYSQASSNPTGYPCSECVPLLSSTVNDFQTPLVGGNSTNVGAALQFCALMDVYRGAPGLQGEGWASNGGVCGWKGITCNDRGRVTQLVLEYPNVPPTLGDTLGNIVAMSSFKLLGNHSVPNGAIPKRLLELQELSELDLEFTALTGPLPDSLNTLPRLRSLTLVNNQQLGGAVPNLSDNRDLSTLVITGQGLKETNFDDLPSSLTYLDLSFNNFEGAVPSLIQLTSLQTLYLTNNNFATPPNSLPSSLQTLSLTSNPSLNGSMPSTLCNNANLRSCDLRNTDLGSGTGGTVVQNSTSAISAVGGGAGRVCGPCRFV